MNSSSVNGSFSSGSAYVSEKRGLAYGHHSTNDLAAMQGKVKWWYNWAVTPEAAVASHYINYGFEFVPMAWNGNFNETALRTYLSNHPEVKYILGFNEPNFLEQANLTPQQAADLWPRLEAVADDYNLKLVAPAVNYSPGEVDIPGTNEDGNPWNYLDAFFAACEGCRVDYIAVHCYMKTSGAFEWFIGQFERYNKPIWVTEWASWDDDGPGDDVKNQMNYLASTVRWLEANPNVYRYSWFIGRTTDGASKFPYIDILAADGTLTPLGGLYTAIPSTNYRHPIPGRIQAEGAHTQSNFTHRATTDSSGYVDLVSAKDSWAEFKIHANESKTYQLNLRLISTLASRKIDILVDGVALPSADLTQSSSWQTYTTSLPLTAGDHTLRVEADLASVIINWIEISNP